MAGSSEQENVPPQRRDSSPEQGSHRGRESSASASRAKGQTALITKVGQVIGLAIGFNQGLLMDHPNRDLVMLAIFLILGVQAVENLLFRVIDRFFDRESG